MGKRLVVAVAVVVIASVGGAWFYFKGPCGTTRVSADVAALEGAGVRVQDVSQVLATTPKFLLSQPIDRLRTIQREVAAMPVASCSVAARDQFAEALDFSINSLVRLITADSEASEYAKTVFEKESVETQAKFTAYRIQIERLKTCAPWCDLR